MAELALCATCPATFDTTTSGRGRPRKRCLTCSPPRTRAYVPVGSRAKTCTGCGSDFMAGSANRLYCTDRCKWSARKPGARQEQPCYLCGDPMPIFPGRTSPPGKSAHKACRRQQPGYRSTRRAHPAVQTWTCVRCSADCERPWARGNPPKLCTDCRPRGGAGVTKAVRFAIYERDEWQCGICHDAVDRELIGTRSAWRPSLDHVIPHVQGGDNDPGNLRLAHMWCNSARGAAKYEDEVFRHAA